MKSSTGYLNVKVLEGVSTLLQQNKDTGVSQSVLNSYGLGGVIDVGFANQVLANSGQIDGLNQQSYDRSQHLNSGLSIETLRSYLNTALSPCVSHFTSSQLPANY